MNSTATATNSLEMRRPRRIARPGGRASIGLFLLALALATQAVRAADCCCASAKSAAAAPLSNRSLYQLDSTWTTDGGQPFTLGQLRGQPLVLAMFFTSCGYACPRIVSDMTQLRQSLPPALRDRTRFVLVSFDDQRDTVAALGAYRELHELTDKNWVLLRGAPGDVRELAALLGVNYRRDAGGQFSHSNLITILNAEGEIIHQRAGLEGGLAEAARAVVASAH
jgi:protein SCO1